MKIVTALNNIEKLVDKINYKSVYIEIETDENKYTIEKNKRNKIGFDTVNKKWNKTL